MLLCPNCKKEYPDELTTCPDCNELLVNSDEDSVVSSDRNDAYDDNGILSEEEAFPDMDYPDDDQDQTAASFFRPGAKPYVMKEEQYRDLQSTVRIFLLFGLAGLLMVLLNLVGILKFFQGILPNLVMGALFLFFVYVGLSTQRKARSLHSEIAAENKLTEQINDWLKRNVTRDFLDSIHDPDSSEELNYIKASDTVKEMLEENFGKQDPAYLDKLYEDYYNDTFED